MARSIDADPEATRERILAVACELLAFSDGTFSTREVARQAGVSIGALQYHYKSRAVLVEACMETVYARIKDLAKSFEQHLDGDESPAEALAKTVRVAFDYLRGNRPFIRLLITTIIGSSDAERHESDAVEQLFLDAAATRLAPGSEISAIEAQMRAKSLIMLAGRYAVMSEATLLGLTKCDSIEEAEKVAEDHLVSVAVALLAAPQ